MKIVLYFSTVFGIFWLIHGALSHNDLVDEGNTVQRSNGSKDREGENLFSESTNLQDKVLIKSEFPLRGRKIHQTAWSKEEDDEVKSQGSKPLKRKLPEFDNSWTLEKLLKDLISYVYETEGRDQHSHIWITAEDKKDKLKQNGNTKNRQRTYTKTEKNKDKIFRNIPTNSKKEHSLKFKKGYLDQDQTFNRKQAKNGIRYESKNSYGNSYEYEESMFDEEQVDENQIDYETSMKKLQNFMTKHTFRGNKVHDKSRIFTKPEQSNSVRNDEITDSEEDCFDDVDENEEENSQIENEKMTLEENISKSNDIEQSSEELIYQNKQETVLNEKHFVNKDIKNVLQNATEKEDSLHANRETHEIIVLNGTQFTGENAKSVKNDNRPETSITEKSNEEFSNSENEVNEKTSKEIFINEHQEIQLDSYTQQEWSESKSNSSQTSNKDEIVNSVLESIAEKNNNDIDENLKDSSPTKSIPLKKQQGSKSSLSETKQTISEINENLNEDVQAIHEGQNEALVISSIDTTIKSQDIDEDNVSILKIHPEILVIDDTRQVKKQTYDKETNNPVDLVITSSIDSTTKSRDLNEETATVLEIHPKILTIDATRQEEMQALYNEETINNTGDLVITSSIDSTTKSQDLNENTAVLEIHPKILERDDTRQEKIQTIYNEDIINPVALKLNQEIGLEIQNSENKELDVQNKIEMHLVEENQKEKTESYKGFLKHQATQSNSRISETENNLQNYEHLNKHLDNQVNENPLIFKFKEDNKAYEYILEGNEFIQLDDHNEEQHKINKYEYESENKSQLLTDSIITILENVQHADDEQQETYDTILEFLYKRSNNPLILSLKENNFTI